MVVGIRLRLIITTIKVQHNSDGADTQANYASDLQHGSTIRAA